MDEQPGEPRTWLRANVTLCEIIGYPLQDLLTMRFPDITHQHDQAADIASLDRLAQGMIQAVTKEKRVLRKDGFISSVNCTVSALRAPDGAIKYYIAIVEDITGRKRMEDTLQLLRTAVESIPLGLTITNLEGRIVYVNPAEALMHGYHPDELLGKEARILAPAQQWSTHSLKDLVDRNVISDAPYAREGYNVRKDGAAFPISIRSVPVRDLRGAPLGIVSVTEDITDRKKMLDALQESEQKYRTLFESANDAIFITDHATGILTDCNVRACELVGSTRDEIISMHQDRLHPPEEAEQYARHGVALAPYWSHAWNTMGRVELMQGKLSEAEVCFDTAARRDKQNIYALFFCLYSCKTAGQTATYYQNISIDNSF